MSGEVCTIGVSGAGRDENIIMNRVGEMKYLCMS